MTPAFYALGLYSGLLGLIGIWLAMNVGKKRQQEKVSIGDGGNTRVVRAMRGQMNFVETVPMALILLMIGAVIGMPVVAIHAGGILLVVGRFLHAVHFTQDDAPGWQRRAGAMLTLLVLTLTSFGLIGHVIMYLF